MPAREEGTAAAPPGLSREEGEAEDDPKSPMPLN